MNDLHAADRKFQKELHAGIVSLVLLSVLDGAGEPSYGYQIAKSIDAGRKSVPMMKQGALYPVLRSLESSGLLDSHVDPSVSGPPRRYYSITDTGRQTLGNWIDIWNNTKNFVDNLLQGEDDG